jgi:hypothetical protein
MIKNSPKIHEAAVELRILIIRIPVARFGDAQVNREEVYSFVPVLMNRQSPIGVPQ